MWAHTGVVIPVTVAGADLSYTDRYRQLVNVFLTGVFDRTKDARVTEPYGAYTQIFRPYCPMKPKWITGFVI